jgi:PAS domain S-box-containing protein
MASTPANPFRSAAALALVALVGALGLLLLRSRPGTELANSSYDLLHQLNGGDERALADSPVVLVYLDLDSFHALGCDPLKPLPRSLHADLASRLKSAGALAIVFDIVFAEASGDTESDQKFATALKQSGCAFLAGEVNDDASHATSEKHERTWTQQVVPPLEWFRTNAVNWGVATHIIDDDYVVRRYLAGFESQEQLSLTWAVARRLEMPLLDDSVIEANRHFLRYYGPALSLPNVSYGQALSSNGVPADFFKDKIVMVGARPMIESFAARKDEFRSPFHSWANKELFMPGVEIHATAMMNLMRGDWLKRQSPAAEAAWILLAAVVFGAGLVWLRPLPATLAAVGGAGLVIGAACLAFSRGVWFPWLIVVVVQIPCALFGSWLYQFQNWFFTRRRMEAAKRVADAKIREQAALIDKAHDAILVQSLDGQVAYANPSAERLYGWTLAELQREGVMAELFSPEAEGAAKARAAAMKDGEWNGELRQQTRAGRVVTVASRWTLIRDDAGVPTALLLMNSDMTEQKQLEQQFLRTQRMNTIGTLAGGMAHDLNNALAPILMGAQLLRRKAGDEETRQMLGMMETSTQRGADMVRQVLLFARGRGGEFERLELGALVKDMEKMVRETFAKNIAVEAFVPGDLWPVHGNLTQLHQILLNLCVNARDAMPAGGKLSFVADNVELDAAEVAAIPEGRPGSFVSLAVSDTGTGMPPEVRAKIFEPFFTTKGEGKGTGIGLATVLRIVKAHGGFLQVDSEPGQGTTFEVFLPRAEAVDLAVTPAAEAELPHGRGELLLIADDEQAIRELMTAELTAFGYRVVVAANGAEAVTLFKQHAAEVKLFITDNLMPVMDGLQAVGELRRIRSTLPVILTSGETSTPLPDGVQVLNKPFTLDDLMRAVGRSLH